MQILKSFWAFGLARFAPQFEAQKKGLRSAKYALRRRRGRKRRRCHSGSCEPEGVSERPCRGRPPKPELTPQPCTETFGVVASKIAAIAKDKSLWQAAKERTRAKADRDPMLSPCSRKVFNFLLDHVNRDKGYDWHGNKSIAADRNMHRRTAQKGSKQLAERGYILRDSVSGRWRTTLPCLIDAAEEIRQEKASKSAGETTKKSQGMRPKIRKNTPNYSPSDAQKIQEPYAHSGTLTSKDSNLENNTLSQPASPMRSGGVDEINSILQKIRSTKRELVISLLIDPMLRQRQFEAPDVAFALAEIADHAADLSKAVLTNALNRVLSERYYVVTASHLEAALDAAKKEAATEDHKALQQEVRVQSRDASWVYWLDHIRAHGERALALSIEKQGFMWAPVEWPRKGSPLPALSKPVPWKVSV